MTTLEANITNITKNSRVMPLIRKVEGLGRKTNFFTVTTVEVGGISCNFETEWQGSIDNRLYRLRRDENGRLLAHEWAGSYRSRHSLEMEAKEVHKSLEYWLQHEVDAINLLKAEMKRQEQEIQEMMNVIAEDKKCAANGCRVASNDQR